MYLFDSHGHLNLSTFAETWQEVLDRSLAQGVVGIVMPGTDLETSTRAVKLAQADPSHLFAGVGLHPTDSQTELAEINFAAYEKLAGKSAVVAIGEVGLETYRIEPDDLVRQEKIFNEFLAIAQRLSKPLIIHIRGSRTPVEPIVGPNPYERMIEMLRQASPRPEFVIHCYQGTKEQAQEFLNLGGFISLTGTITYSDHSSVTEVVASIPLERLLIETDSPFLSPAPHRGEQNEPWKVSFVAERVAVLKGLSLAEVAMVTTKNAQKFFKISL